MEVRPMAVPERLLIDYPQLWELEDGTEVTVRPMVKEARDKLAEFFKRIPDQELRVLKDDVTGGTVIDQWAQSLDYDRVLPLVVEIGGRIIADATLPRRRQSWQTGRQERAGCGSTSSCGPTTSQPSSCSGPGVSRKSRGSGITSSIGRGSITIWWDCTWTC